MAEDRRKLIGGFSLGVNPILIFVSNDTGGMFTDATKDGKTHVTIGLRYEHFDRVIAVLLHELTELALADIGCRFSPSVDFAKASDGYVFHADHRDFSEAIARVGYVVSLCFPKIYIAWRGARRKHVSTNRT